VDIIPSGDNCFTNAVFASDAACPLGSCLPAGGAVCTDATRSSARRPATSGGRSSPLSRRDDALTPISTVSHPPARPPSSRAECPVVTQAPGIVHRLCGGRGICDYDRSKTAARCFCNQGWSGVDCMSQGDKGLPAAPSYAGPIAGGFVGGVLGGAALLLGVLFARAKVSRAGGGAQRRTSGERGRSRSGSAGYR
jgi:hypothetical protein